MINEVLPGKERDNHSLEHDDIRDRISSVSPIQMMEWRHTKLLHDLLKDRTSSTISLEKKEGDTYSLQ